MSNKFEEIIDLIKNKNFEKLKEEIINLEDTKENDKLKTIILSNFFLKFKQSEVADDEYEKEKVKGMILFFLKDVKFSIENKINMGEGKEYSFPMLSLISGDVDIVDAMIKYKNVDINIIENGANLLFKSIGLKNKEISNYLIDAGINIMPFKDHPSVLNIAIVNQEEMNDPGIIDKILDGYNFDFEYENSEDPIILALKFSEELAKKIIKSHYKIKLRRNGNTPFESYSIVSDLISDETFRMICEKIKNDIDNVNYKLMQSIPALHILISKKDSEKINILLDMGLNIEVVATNNDNMFYSESNIVGMTPLMFATYAGFYHIVKLLVDRGANPNVKDVMGSSAISVALLSNSETFINLLSSKDIDVSFNLSRKGYKNSLHELAKIVDPKATELMMEKLKSTPEALNKVIVSSTDFNSGFSILMQACYAKNYKMIEALLSIDGIDVNVSGSNGNTALSLLLDDDIDDSEVTSLEKNMDEIINNGENVNETTGQEEKSDKILSLLINKGAEINFKVNGVKFMKNLPKNKKEKIKSLYEDKNGKSFISKIFS